MVTAVDDLIANLQNLKKSLKAESAESLIKHLTLASNSRAAVEALEIKIKKQEFENVSVSSGQLIPQLQNFAQSAVSIIDFKNQNGNYEIKLVR